MNTTAARLFYWSDEKAATAALAILHVTLFFIESVHDRVIVHVVVFPPINQLKGVRVGQKQQKFQLT